MQKFGLIGFPLSHSFSKIYFEKKFEKENILNSSYSLFPIETIEQIYNLIKDNTDLIGLNVTTPYKEAIIPLLNEIDDTANNIGAVNTIKITRHSNGTLTKGYNTDIYGFRKLIQNITLPNKALILGSAGSAKTISYVLKELGINFQFVSRSPKTKNEFSYTELNKEIINSYSLLINASPVGMFPNIEKCPDIPYNEISPKHICIDLIYNPAETLFLKKCKIKGAKTINGIEMLYEQAEQSWKIWKNK